MRHKRLNEVFPYTYLVTRISDGMKYHGARYQNVKQEVTPQNDIGLRYFTSGKLKKECKDNPEDYTFEVRWTFDTVAEALTYEEEVNRRIYKRPDWANLTYGKNFGDHPEIGRLISEGLNRVGEDGLTPSQRGSEKRVDWIWGTPEGKRYREGLTAARTEHWRGLSPEERKTQLSHLQDLDRAEIIAKAVATKKATLVGGRNVFERAAKKAAKTKEGRYDMSEYGRARNVQYNERVGKMTNSEFLEWCQGKTQRAINGATTRRTKWQMEN